ncbi:hypothetical protein AcV5_003711 [Taiwanofungus camphoratus]|nr:hypothetical protein AcV5_003711 [Antrodia cinnamomea]KAI0951721.1 hypothetical protein AcV7_007739 [Antrodia cinnamomea]
MYARVINTTALPCLRTTDLAAAELDSDQSAALSELQYGSTTKIRVKFKTAWWGEAAVMKELGGCGAIVGGQSFTDRMFTVFTVSYARTADASRWHPLLREELEEQLKEIVLRDIAAVHGFDPVKEVESMSGTPCIELGQRPVFNGRIRLLWPGAVCRSNQASWSSCCQGQASFCR